MCLFIRTENKTTKRKDNEMNDREFINKIILLILDSSLEPSKSESDSMYELVTLVRRYLGTETSAKGFDKDYRGDMYL